MTHESPLRLAYLAQPNEQLARDWMAFFADRGHDVSVLVRAATEIRPGLHPAIAIHRLPQHGGLAFGRLGAPGARRAIQSVLRAIRPDVLHVHDLMTGFGWTARLSGFHPYVITAWGSDLYIDIGRTWATRTLGRLSLAGADLVTAESRDLQRRAIAAGARPSAVHQIQFGVDTERFTPRAPDADLRARLGIGDRRVIFAPRQIAPLYRQIDIVRAAARLGDDVVVIMSSREAVPDHLAELQAETARLGIEERLRIVPAISHADMVGFYRLADVVVSVPDSDSISVCILEAMACGVPVVGSDLPSTREWLTGGAPDAVAPRGDVDALAAAIAGALALAPAERQRWASGARMTIVARADWRTNMLEMESLYRSIARRPLRREQATA
jgi:glycosyltransferase involved in cell wall biosynthesis